MPRNKADYNWTAEAVATLRQLWDEAHSTLEIGRRLGTSKNAVIGKARRLALPGRPSPIRWGGAAAEPPARQTMAVARMPTATMPSGKAAVMSAGSSDAPPAGTPIAATIPELRARPARERRECCWPIGEPRTAGFRLCGAPALTKAPYCEAHARSAYVHARPERGHGSLKRDATNRGENPRFGVDVERRR